MYKVKLVTVVVLRRLPLVHIGAGPRRGPAAPARRTAPPPAAPTPAPAAPRTAAPLAALPALPALAPLAFAPTWRQTLLLKIKYSQICSLCLNVTAKSGAGRDRSAGGTHEGGGPRGRARARAGARPRRC